MGLIYEKNLVSYLIGMTLSSSVLYTELKKMQEQKSEQSVNKLTDCSRYKIRARLKAFLKVYLKILLFVSNIIAPRGIVNNATAKSPSVATRPATDEAMRTTPANFCMSKDLILSFFACLPSSGLYSLI